MPHKKGYVRGDRPKVECILCSVARKDPQVVNLRVAGDRHVFITMNLFPYNPGHIMIVPRRHILDPRARTRAERESMDRWTHRVLDLLDELFAPAGYNVGYNVGLSSGASIEHLHLHIVPRFRNEIGFIDVIGGSRVHVDDPRVTLETLKERLRRRK